MAAVVIAARRRKNVILFLDDLHQCVARSRTQAVESEALRTLLLSSAVRCIGATTPMGYETARGDDTTVSRVFSVIDVGPSSESESYEILDRFRARLQAHHGVQYTDGSLRAAITAAPRLAHLHLPESALAIIDEAGSRTHSDVLEAPNLSALSAEIERLDGEKEAAIGAEDFERATSRRDDGRAPAQAEAADRA